MPRDTVPDDGPEMEASLAQDLRRFPDDLDSMFIKFVDIRSSRSAFRINLNMLAGH